MRFNAIVLAGGRSSRLAAGDKARLRHAGRTLAEIAVGAVATATATVVVGPSDLTDTLPGVTGTLEQPRFGGPAAALAAGLDRLEGADLEWTAVLACDLPFAAEAIAVVLDEVAASSGSAADGVLGVDDEGREQPLLAVYRTAALRTAVAALGPEIAGAPLRNITRSLRLDRVALPGTLAADIDTQQDAARFGIDVASSLTAQTSIR